MSKVMTNSAAIGGSSRATRWVVLARSTCRLPFSLMAGGEERKGGEVCGVGIWRGGEGGRRSGGGGGGGSGGGGGGGGEAVEGGTGRCYVTNGQSRRPGVRQVAPQRPAAP